MSYDQSAAAWQRDAEIAQEEALRWQRIATKAIAEVEGWREHAKAASIAAAADFDLGTAIWRERTEKAESALSRIQAVLSDGSPTCACTMAREDETCPICRIRQAMRG